MHIPLIILLLLLFKLLASAAAAATAAIDPSSFVQAGRNLNIFVVFVGVKFLSSDSESIVAVLDELNICFVFYKYSLASCN